MRVRISKTEAVTVRLDPEFKARLTAVSRKLDLSENDVVRHSLRAALRVIELNDYKIGSLDLLKAAAEGIISNPEYRREHPSITELPRAAEDDPDTLVIAHGCAKNTAKPAPAILYGSSSRYTRPAPHHSDE